MRPNLHRRPRLFQIWMIVIALCTSLVGGYAVTRASSATPPILLVTNSAAPNPFGSYLGEILRAEGIKAFNSAQLSSLTSTNLTDVKLVLLAETPLSSAQASLFNSYVAGGGRLIAMRPDAQLNATLGVTLQGSSTSEGYIGIKTNTTSGAGFTATTLPFHGAAYN